MMKITGVHIWKLLLPTDQWMIVTIDTDEGITGWGEVTGSCDDEGLAGILRKAGEVLAGHNPLHIEECTSCFWSWSYPVRRTIRTYAAALSGIDQALWDITAKYYGVPLYKLYGGDGKKEIPLYANLNKALWGKRSSKALQENGKAAYEAGFTMVKCTPFDEINPSCVDSHLDCSMERMKALAEVVPVERIAIDCHQRFEGFTLARMVKRVVEECGVPYWIEDPVPVYDYQAVRSISDKYPEIRWAAGEDALDYRQILEISNSQCYEVLMPDLKYIGGPSVIKALIPVLEGVGKKVTLHNPNGIIATAHSAHASALCRSNMPMEFPFMAVKDRELLAASEAVIKNGTYVFSEAPGIGVEISEDAMKEYGHRYGKHGWS